MASIARMIGRAIINAMAFFGGDYLGNILVVIQLAKKRSVMILPWENMKKNIRSTARKSNKTSPLYSY